MQQVSIGNCTLGDNTMPALICGPCVIESEESALSSASFLKNLADRLGLCLIFKSSYDKANRSSLHSFRGPGLDRGLFILERIKKEFDLPVLTDVHTPQEARAAAEVCDVLQIPAFLCRQTDLLVAAAHTGRVVNVKKGQFLAPWDMKPVVEKIVEGGNQNIILTERGATFGYNNLVSDMRSLPILRKLGYPVCFDATHSVQLPGGHGSSSGGQREFIAPLARAAVAVGIDCLFLEAHPNPKEALSDRDSQIPFDALESLLRSLMRIHKAVRDEASHV